MLYVDNYNTIQNNKCREKTFRILTHFIVLFFFIQTISIILIVFIPVDTQHDSHYIVAILTFGSAIIKSFLLLIRRCLIIQVDHLWITLNVIYEIVIIILATLFAIYLNGVVEWMLIILIVFENIFLTIDYHRFSIHLSLIDNDNKMREIGYRIFVTKNINDNKI